MSLRKRQKRFQINLLDLLCDAITVNVLCKIVKYSKTRIDVFASVRAFIYLASRIFREFPGFQSLFMRSQVLMCFWCQKVSYQCQHQERDVSLSFRTLLLATSWEICFKTIIKLINKGSFEGFRNIMQ